MGKEIERIRSDITVRLKLKKKSKKKSSKENITRILPYTSEPNKLTIGLEEIRQIFIAYPSLHSLYEEKVPHEINDQQFWKIYFECEYFHHNWNRIFILVTEKDTNELYGNDTEQ